VRLLSGATGMTTIVSCPICGADVPWTEASRWRPFCSERCRTIDLGEWAAQRRAIPGSAPDTTEETPPQSTANH
jgi:hypothetical protein